MAQNEGRKEIDGRLPAAHVARCNGQAEINSVSRGIRRAMPRKRDVNLSLRGNAISRLWSPFGCGG